MADENVKIQEMLVIHHDDVFWAFHTNSMKRSPWEANSRSAGYVCSRFSTEILYVFLIALAHATCPVHLILLELVILIIFSEQHKLWTSTIVSFLLLCPHVLLAYICTHKTKNVIMQHSVLPSVSPIRQSESFGVVSRSFSFQRLWNCDNFKQGSLVKQYLQNTNWH
jgi:hypothetical protein